MRVTASRLLRSHSLVRFLSSGLACLSLPYGALSASEAFKSRIKLLKRLLIRVVILPVAEVGDDVLANLTGGIFSGVERWAYAFNALTIASRMGGNSSLTVFQTIWSSTL